MSQLLIKESLLYATAKEGIPQEVVITLDFLDEKTDNVTKIALLCFKGNQDGTVRCVM